jgi:hypothetical protein
MTLVRLLAGKAPVNVNDFVFLPRERYDDEAARDGDIAVDLPSHRRSPPALVRPDAAPGWGGLIPPGAPCDTRCSPAVLGRRDVVELRRSPSTAGPTDD